MMGPPVRDPDSPSATNTETARSPSMATIQAWVLGGLAVPYSAVPDLAITAGPASRSTEPVPRVTTSRIMERNVDASAAVRAGPEAVLVALGAAGVAGGATSLGVTTRPAAMDAATVAIPSGEARIFPWPIMDAACSVWLLAVSGTSPE